MLELIEESTRASLLGKVADGEKHWGGRWGLGIREKGGNSNMNQGSAVFHRTSTERTGGWKSNSQKGRKTMNNH